MCMQDNSSDWVSKAGGYQLTVASVESQLFKAWREGTGVQLPRTECLVPGSDCLSCLKAVLALLSIVLDQSHLLIGDLPLYSLVDW